MSLAAFDAFKVAREISLAHAERLLALGPVRVLALDPCPRCGGRVVASEVEARCTACAAVLRRAS